MSGIGRNEPCPCGSGRKYKNCCLRRHEDAAAELLREQIAGGQAILQQAYSPETWRGWGLPDRTIAEIFRAAARFWRARPWRCIDGDQALRADLGTARPWACCVLGNAGAEFGLALYAEEDDLLRTLDDGVEAHITGPVISLTFGHATDLPSRMRREVLAAGWEVAASEAFPLILTLGSRGGLPHGAAEDLVLLLRAIPDFVDHHEDVLDPVFLPESAIEWTSPDSGVRLRLDADSDQEIDWSNLEPLGLDLFEPFESMEPCLAMGPGADSSAALEPIPERTADIEAHFRGELSVLDRFERWLREAGRSEATIGKHVRNSYLFLDFLLYNGVPLRAVSEFDLRMFLFDFHPRRSRDAVYRVEAMPVSLQRFFGFIADREGILCPWSVDVLADRDAYRARFDSFPGGYWEDDRVEEWRGVLLIDLIGRILIHGPLHADDTLWDPSGGPIESRLDSEVQRHWLIWRDEAIRAGAVSPAEVLAIALERQFAWEQEPHPRLGGRTPLKAVQQERRMRKT